MSNQQQCTHPDHALRLVGAPYNGVAHWRCSVCNANGRTDPQSTKIAWLERDEFFCNLWEVVGSDVQKMNNTGK